MELGKNMLGYFGGKPKDEVKPVETTEEAKTEEVVEKTTEQPKEEAQKEKPIEPAEQTIEKPKEEIKPEVKVVEEEVEPKQITDEDVLNFLKQKSGKEIKSFDDLFKEPEPIADPLEGVSEEAKQFLNFTKETGRGIDEWNKLNTDYSKLSPLDLARQKVLDMSNGIITTVEEADEYLQKKLNVDLSDPSEIDKTDLVDLKNFSSDYLEKLNSEKEKYRKPVEQKEMITLDNGQKMLKEDYDNLLNQRNQYLDAIKASANNITTAKFDIGYDDNGEQKAMEIVYDYSKDDVHSMTSSASDVDATIAKLFRTEKGFDYSSFQEALFWMNPERRKKAINAIVHKALAQRTEELLVEETNPGKAQPKMPLSGQPKKAELPQQKSVGKVLYEF